MPVKGLALAIGDPLRHAVSNGTSEVSPNNSVRVLFLSGYLFLSDYAELAVVNGAILRTSAAIRLRSLAHIEESGPAPAAFLFSRVLRDRSLSGQGGGAVAHRGKLRGSFYEVGRSGGNLRMRQRA